MTAELMTAMAAAPSPISTPSLVAWLFGLRLTGCPDGVDVFPNGNCAIDDRPLVWLTFGLQAEDQVHVDLYGIGKFWLATKLIERNPLHQESIIGCARRSFRRCVRIAQTNAACEIWRSS